MHVTRVKKKHRVKNYAANCTVTTDMLPVVYRGADKSSARTGSKQATATEDFEFHIHPIYYHKWRNTYLLTYLLTY